MKSFSISIAGSTEHTRVCAQALRLDHRFTIHSVITPGPRPIGRKQILTKNPMHRWAQENEIPTVLVERKIDETVRKSDILQLAPDLLLVVDFGYIVPQWLLDWPMVAPVNIHPSDLPKYRGSSPGQFALLFGETTSAVSLIVMDNKLDHGPIITKLPFDIDPHWTAKEYYHFAFDLVRTQLSSILFEFSSSDQRPATEQTDKSPTPIARRFTRDDGFVPFPTVLELVTNASGITSFGQPEAASHKSIPLLASYQFAMTKLQLFNMYRALTPWPGIWTKVQTTAGEKRVKILELRWEQDKLTLTKIQIEGKNIQSLE